MLDGEPCECDTKTLFLGKDIEIELSQSLMCEAALSEELTGFKDASEEFLLKVI